MWAVEIGSGASGAFEIQSWKQPRGGGGMEESACTNKCRNIKPTLPVSLPWSVFFLDFPWFPGTITGTPTERGVLKAWMDIP